MYKIWPLLSCIADFTTRGSTVYPKHAVVSGVDERPGPPRVLKVSRERHDGRGLPCLLFVSNLDLPITVSLYHYEHSFPTYLESGIRVNFEACSRVNVNVSEREKIEEILILRWETGPLPCYYPSR